ncbi:MAG: hypothetical protein IPI01_05465 [Ignavibacteriae bacterium]|nr:hypothetical protein [Ignavibacteriota bacterium]
MACCTISGTLHEAFAQKARYLVEIRAAAEKGWRDLPAGLQKWRENPNHSVLWGYNSPPQPLYLAGVYSYLYKVTGQELYAERSVALLAAYGDLRQTLPAGFEATRAEYEQGVPSISNFFYLPPYVRAVREVKGSAAFQGPAREKIERDVAESIDFVFRFPEWGAHNRAALRAEALLGAAEALPDHKSSARWRAMAMGIGADNLRHWEIEDATVYHPVWLHAVLSFGDIAGRADVARSPMMHYYMEYFSRLMAPSGLIPDYGDAYWLSSLEGLRMVAIFERMAATFGDQGAKWAALRLLETAKGFSDTLSSGDAYYLCDAHRWANETIVPRHPEGGSEEVIDDVIGKKVVFRNGWDPASTYMLLNYRDEGDGGWLGRHYLRNTISVEEEKMHHGHADENSIVLLMDSSSVLLHDAGYRNDLPSGAFGAWRQDYFHNRLVVRNEKRDQRQKVLAFVQNSGAYHAVRTQKIDFVSLRDADMSRTRVTDETRGYVWDRIVAYAREPGVFVVVDGVKATRPDYFTFTNFWHAGTVLDSNRHAFTIAVDSIGEAPVAGKRALKVLFLENTAKTEGYEPISRHRRTEQALYQTISSHYKAGDMEVFVTALIPVDRVARGGRIPRVSLVPTSRPMQAVAVRIDAGEDRLTLGIKLDLESEIARENIRPRYQYDLGRTTYGGAETDAHFFTLREANGDVRVSAVNVLKFAYAGTTMMSALPNTHGLQLDGSKPRVGYSKWRVWEGTN